MGEVRRPVVLGVGNTLCRDEGVGVHLLTALEARLAAGSDAVIGSDAVAGFGAIDWVDGGTLGLRLLSVVESSSHLLVLDAVDAARPPGSVIELSDADLAAPTGLPMSGHELGLGEVLGLARARGRLPDHLWLIGVQPDDMSMGLDLSSRVAEAVPTALDAAERVLRQWGLPQAY